MRFYSDIETCSTLEGARAQQTDFTGAMTAIGAVRDEGEAWSLSADAPERGGRPR
jgi:hypothetical protein